MTGENPQRMEGSTAVSDLPVDELIVYGRELGLNLNSKMGQGELLRLVRERQELLVILEHAAMLDVMVWARHPVRQSASKEQLAKQIATVRRMDFSDLSLRGLTALAMLRGINVSANDAREIIEARLRDAEPFWDRVARKRRGWVGSVISRMVDSSQEQGDEDYKFLPEEGKGGSLKNQIAEEGIVGGIAKKIRGVADDYVKEKLDEIEIRIDHKLDEIDRRLAEWRDREVATRLRIIKMTLVATVLVALLSYGYSLLKHLSDSQ